jgi:hypothetical protein
VLLRWGGGGGGGGVLTRSRLSCRQRCEWCVETRSEMEWRFFVEAKSFAFSVEEGGSVLRLEERRRGFTGVLYLGFQCIEWLVLTVEEFLQNPDVKDFVKSFREDSKALIVQRGGNKVGRYLEVAAYAVGGRKGLVLLPEGREGRGWSRVAGELSKALACLEAICFIRPLVIVLRWG